MRSSLIPVGRSCSAPQGVVAYWASRLRVVYPPATGRAIDGLCRGSYWMICDREAVRRCNVGVAMQGRESQAPRCMRAGKVATLALCRRFARGSIRDAAGSRRLSVHVPCAYK